MSSCFTSVTALQFTYNILPFELKRPLPVQDYGLKMSVGSPKAFVIILATVLVLAVTLDGNWADIYTGSVTNLSILAQADYKLLSELEIVKSRWLLFPQNGHQASPFLKAIHE